MCPRTMSTADGAAASSNLPKKAAAAAAVVQKIEIDMNEDLRRVMLRCGIKDQPVQVEYDGSMWTLLLRKKLAKPEGGAWNTLVYLDAYHMENDKHFGACALLESRAAHARAHVPSCGFGVSLVIAAAYPPVSELSVAA